MANDAVQDVEEEAENVEEDTAKEVMEEAIEHIKTGVKSHMSPVNLNMQSGPHYQTNKEKG